MDDIVAAASIRDSATLPAPPRPPSSRLSPTPSPLGYSPSPSPTPSMRVPAVVVSPEPASTASTSASHAGRVPSRLPPGTANFSRPVHLPFGSPSVHEGVPPRPPPASPLPPPPNEQHSRSQRPPIVGSEEQKRQVLMRHAQGSSRSVAGLGAGPSSGSLVPGPRPGANGGEGLSPNAQMQRSSSQTGSVYSNYSDYPYSGSSETLPSPSIVQPGPSHSPSHSRSHSPSQPPIADVYSRSRSPHAPSPTPSHSAPSTHQPQRSQPHVQPPEQPQTPSEPKTPQDFLQLGITHHLANRLAESAVCFEKSATLNGGCGVGMLMWGLAQRHGWGVEKNEDKGFRWLRKAAELAVTDLEKGKDMDRTAVKSELVLAIYEVGQSFFRGWGVEKDKKMAVVRPLAILYATRTSLNTNPQNYFQLAAKLGDPDAQQDLAFCLANGKGCKKDRKEAAKWYRAAVAQGASDIGLAWIYKEKFQ
ncbi:hypothetical protein EIP86_011565 [Pleurotus ostreatoroseus]|nr:hypothetical protein EIP86_011565 [Pleurotus ostreatoroseus]